MSNVKLPPLTSSELANLWMTYQEKTMIIRFLEYFLEDKQDYKELFELYYSRSLKSVERIKEIFENEGAVIPIGFTKDDVNVGVPKLYDHMFEVMYIRLMSQIETGLFALHSTMSYREDVRNFFVEATAEAQDIYNQSTQILLETGVIAKPPYVSMPKEVHFVHAQNYIGGLSWFSEKRSLNTIEVSLIQHAVDTNLVGMQLMIGFAQVANNKEAQQHFVSGMKLSKKIETELGDILRDSYIEPPATHAGKATNSTVPPFSDKLMMYNTSLLSTFGLGSNALGGAFSLRSDLPLKMLQLAKDIYSLAKEGGKIMIKNGWLEEPPQIEDRDQLTKK
ncbi:MULTISPECIES: DUF3231 family protein [Priestia]|uniref:DUF3231 family protein n=1 Tax=Priestia TaxID=2800373 RepID=UPI002041D535|nr:MULTISPECIES: DUF3231 family protein [Priestia]MCM3770583.1 DUF3231 family protein [Priestia aryabhattai]MDY0940951.1 DUF3231 family protein [Priestia megaterium]